MQTHITVQRPSRGQRIIAQCKKPSLQFFKITDLGTRANGYTTATFLTALSGKDVGDTNCTDSQQHASFFHVTIDTNESSALSKQGG